MPEAEAESDQSHIISISSVGKTIMSITEQRNEEMLSGYRILSGLIPKGIIVDRDIQLGINQYANHFPGCTSGIVCHTNPGRVKISLHDTVHLEGQMIQSFDGSTECRGCILLGNIMSEYVCHSLSISHQNK